MVGSWRDIRIGLNGALRGVGDAAEETDTGPGSWAPTVAADIPDAFMDVGPDGYHCLSGLPGAWSRVA